MLGDNKHHLERLNQAVKLLQLPKSTPADIDVMIEVCSLLNHAQIRKLLLIYAVSDYENPISSNILTEVTRRGTETAGNDSVLLDGNELGDQVLYLKARKVEVIEKFVPPRLRIPRVRALLQFQYVG